MPLLAGWLFCSYRLISLFLPFSFLRLAFSYPVFFLGFAFFCPVLFLGLAFPNILCARASAYDCLLLGGWLLQPLRIASAVIGCWLFLTASFALFVFQQKALIIADEQAGEREGDNHSYQA